MPWRTITGAESVVAVVTMTQPNAIYIVLRNGAAILNTRPKIVRAWARLKRSSSLTPPACHMLFSLDFCRVALGLLHARKNLAIARIRCH